MIFCKFVNDRNFPSMLFAPDDGQMGLTHARLYSYLIITEFDALGVT
jgi:hypothetical protein